MPAKVLFVVNHAGFFLSHRLPLATGAAAQGYEVHVATPQSKHVPRIRDAGLAWHSLPLARSSRDPQTELTTLLAIRRLYRTLRPDLVHHVTAKPVLYGTPIARSVGVRAVVNAVTGLGHVFADDGVAQRLTRSAVSLGYRFALRHPRMRVIFQNPELAAAFISRGWVQPPECVLIPGSGVDTCQFKPREESNTREVPNVMFASRLLYTKGIREFVEAARILRARGVSANFIVVGEPDPDNPASVSRDQIEAWTGCGVVTCWGRSEAMADVFAQADIVCLPSYSEGMPKVLIEAASCGLPIVTTDIPGCRAVARHGDNGLLVPARDAHALAGALDQLIRNPDARKVMGRRGRERAVAEFSLNMVVDRTLAVYAELLA